MNQRGDGKTSQGLEKNSLLSMTEEKMTRFIYGGYQDNRHEREKKEKLEKKRKEEEETAVAYSEYEKTFDHPAMSNVGAPMFVRGGTINNKGIAESQENMKREYYMVGNQKIEEPKITKSIPVQSTQSTQSTSKPQPLKMTFTKFVPVSKKTQQDHPKKVQETDLKSMFGSHEEIETDKKKDDKSIKVNRKTNIHYAVHNNGEKSQLDLLYEKMSQELKVQQSIQLKNQNRRDSHNQDDDEEDLLNTSVFFWNLPHHITEEALYKLCAYYGHVRSVTIKYPKQGADSSSAGVLGFVGMNTHEEAKLVITCLTGYNLDEYTIRTGWGRGVNKTVLLNIPSYAKIHCIKAPSSTIRSFIQRIAVYVHNRGYSFEMQLLDRIQKEEEKEKWSFLLDFSSYEYLYYRWCLLVLGNHESFTHYSLLPFQFDENGDWFLPPPVYNANQVNEVVDEKLANLKKNKEENMKKIQDDEKKKEERYEERRLIQGSNIFLDSIRYRLSTSQYEWLIGSLQSITPNRSSILRIMTFCMDNASCAEHIVEILRDSICDNVPFLQLFIEEIDDGQPKKETIPCQSPIRLARLYVVNDLLYNADNGCTTSYRTLIQSELPIMFEAIARMKNSIENAIVKKEIRVRIEKMVNGWIQNSLLSINFLRGLQVTFMMVDTNEELDMELEDESEDSNIDDLRLQCKYNGLCNYGTKGQLLMRLKKLEEYTEQQRNEMKVEEIPKLDNELDGEPLSDSDYDGCF